MLNRKMNNYLNAIDIALTTENWYAALALALTLPDICGKLESPTQGSQQRYAVWFDNYVSPKYTHRVGVNYGEVVFLNGNDCYALRCSFLHEGNNSILHQRARNVLDDFRFVVTGGAIHCSKSNNTLLIDVATFCSDIRDSISVWLIDVRENQDVQNRANSLLEIQFHL
ncbi:hypothetical protein [Paenibacillus alkalitolerans]|uniref:hypothetical protein n=1 Tax=Paenibacillus alkalitolerans TaxID=2799335 RepID=UPI0018F7607A|nr:hypothetical protein [Paenibacillus alkalitolerans]